MFGLFFLQHADLRRILTDYSFLFFPLRKDFPLSGFTEMLYSEKRKKLTYCSLSFLQDYRSFSLKSN